MDAERSYSDTEIAKHTEATPPNFVSQTKRKRDDDIIGEFYKLKEEMEQMFNKMLISQTTEFKKNSTILKEIQEINKNIENTVASLSLQNEDFKKKLEQLEEKRKEDKKVRGKKDSSPNTPIVVETTSTVLKTDMLKSCKQFSVKQKQNLSVKHLGISSSIDTPISVTEQLTAKTARLHFLVSELVKSKLFKYCWTNYGRIYLRKDDNSQISNESQLKDLSSVK
ncbi:hypothetical protein ACJJTC_008462 [Scirpophaga incertulas]